jgi:hypothetical protein
VDDETVGAPGDVAGSAKPAAPVGSEEARHRENGPARAASGAAVIVLTYPFGGAWRLRALLERHPELACTSGTGILPLCDYAAAAWRSADGRDGGSLSPLAASSIRALTGSIITTVLARHGKRRWCEIATAAPATAETFLRLYPETRVISLHRACADAGYAALSSSPWGLSGATFAPFTAAYPDSTPAALAAWWAAHTASLLAFEEAHPGRCRRLRFEDLADGEPPDLPGFLGLAEPAAPPGHSRGLEPAAIGPAPADGADGTSYEPGRLAPAGAAVPPMPAEQIAARLQAQVNELAAQLGYSPVC